MSRDERMGVGVYERRLVSWADEGSCAAGWHTPELWATYLVLV
jgi:hypothetical protein